MFFASAGFLRSALSAAALAAFLTWPLIGRAWGPEGHEVIAVVAERYLAPAARDRAAELLSEERDPSLSAASLWLDKVRPFRPETAAWHYTNIPVGPGPERYDPARDCPGDQCAIAQIGIHVRALREGQGTAKQRRETLKIVLHLVGDLHQPLHNADRGGDKGGNLVAVRFFGERSNLHKVWDGDILRTIARDGTKAYADEIADRIDPALKLACEKGGPAEWADEAHDLARSVAYRLPRGKEPPAIGPAYMKRAAPAIERQLQCGGVRLARILNEALR